MIITSVREKTCLGNPLVVLLMRMNRVRNRNLIKLESIFSWRTLALDCQETKWKGIMMNSKYVSENGQGGITIQRIAYYFYQITV